MLHHPHSQTKIIPDRVTLTWPDLLSTLYFSWLWLVWYSFEPFLRIQKKMAPTLSLYYKEHNERHSTILLISFRRVGSYTISHDCHNFERHLTLGQVKSRPKLAFAFFCLHAKLASQTEKCNTTLHGSVWVQKEKKRITLPKEKTRLLRTSRILGAYELDLIKVTEGAKFALLLLFNSQMVKYS